MAEMLSCGEGWAVELSVVIACLDAEQTLPAQLAALATQRSRRPWEVIVVDNGSADGSCSVVDAFSGVLPNLRLVRATARRGAGYARNVGAGQACGRYLLFCDADDVVGAGWLEAMAAALEVHEFVAGRFEFERLNGSRARRSRTLDQQDGLQWAQIGGPQGLRLAHAGAGNMGIHADLFARLGGFDTEIPGLEDTDLSWRAQLEGVELAYAPEAEVCVRLRDTLPGMWRQGRTYGRAYALLERRFASGPSPSAGPPVSAPRTARRSRLAAWFGTGGRPSVGRVVWQLGWHAGYRGMTVTAATAATAATAVAAVAAGGHRSPAATGVAAGVVGGAADAGTGGVTAEPSP